MREERDLYFENGVKSDKTYFKGDSIPEGYYPMVVMVAIQNSKGEFLMQKRVPSKGGDWGVTGGHPKVGESPIQGIITEVKEELGVEIFENEIIEFNRGCDGKDCYVMYYLKKNFDLSKLEIQLEELSEVRWFSMEQLRDMVETKELNEDQIAFFLKCVRYLES